MDPITAREKLNLFFDTLPDSVFFPLRDKGLDPSLLTTDIASAYEFVIRETGNICEGVFRVLKGEDSPSNFVGFIQKDEKIEEDNRQKIPALAYEIQQKLFEPVLPILKQAGFPIKEGKVAMPIINSQFPIPNGQPAVVSPYVLENRNQESGIRNQANRTPIPPPQGSSLPATSYPPSGGLPPPPMDERNLRALLRIAAGTK